jgi:ATP-dependent Clp protease ATP-binding subunit ClpA
MFERYTEEARRAIFFARAESLFRKAPAISVQDLLLGLTREKKSRANYISELKSQDADFRASFGVAPLPQRLDSSLIRPRPQLPLDDDAKKTLWYTAQEADLDREFWVDTDHLLRGLLRFPNDATAALSKAAIELESLQAASIQNRKVLPSKPVVRFVGLKEFARRHRWRLLLFVILLAIFLYLKSQG